MSYKAPQLHEFMNFLVHCAGLHRQSSRLLLCGSGTIIVYTVDVGYFRPHLLISNVKMAREKVSYSFSLC